MHAHSHWQWQWLHVWLVQRAFGDDGQFLQWHHFVDAFGSARAKHQFHYLYRQPIWFNCGLDQFHGCRSGIEPSAVFVNFPGTQGPVYATTTLNVPITATDPDIPANYAHLRRRLRPDRRGINANSGLLTWTADDRPGRHQHDLCQRDRLQSVGGEQPAFKRDQQFPGASVGVDAADPHPTAQQYSRNFR